MVRPLGPRYLRRFIVPYKHDLGLALSTKRLSRAFLQHGPVSVTLPSSSLVLGSCSDASDIIYNRRSRVHSILFSLHKTNEEVFVATSASVAMNTESSKVNSLHNSSALRPRNRRPLSEDYEFKSAATTLKSVSQLDRPQFLSSRAPSPIPSKHPSRSASSSRDLENLRSNNQSNGGSGAVESQATASTFATGLWGTSWSSLQGIASNLLSSDTLGTSNTSIPSQRRHRRPLEATHIRAPSAPPAQWGPSGGGERQLGHGARADRLAQVQAKKRETLLAANDYLDPDASGRYKRRDSPERGPESAPPDENGDRDALIYVHKVKSEDTLAGIILKYSCKPDIFRRANRLWPNDSIQVRKTVVLPVDACGIRGRKIPNPNDLIGDDTNDTMQTPTNTRFSWDGSTSDSKTKETPLSSITTSPSISATPSNPEEPPWEHDSWVSIDGFPELVEIARLSRRTLGYFPPRRRKSVSFSDVETPQSLDLPRSNYFDNSSPSRQKSKSRSSSGSYFATHLQGPGGVGTLGRDVHSPGPAQDGLNRMFAAHLPNVAPRASFESITSNSSAGLENVGGAIEGWVRKLASRAARSVQPPTIGGKPGAGDLIELSDALDIGEDAERGPEGGRAGADRNENLGSSVGRWSDDQERLLRERFPPRGRVFAESPRRKGD